MILIPNKVVRVKNGVMQQHIYTEEEKKIIIERLEKGEDRRTIDDDLNFEWKTVQK